MLILSRVCAEFHDSGGRLLLSVRPENLLSFIEAPEEIQADPLFALLQRDGSLEAVRSVSQRRQLENDPLADTAADGRKASLPSAEPEAGADFSAAAMLEGSGSRREDENPEGLPDPEKAPGQAGSAEAAREAGSSAPASSRGSRSSARKAAAK